MTKKKILFFIPSLTTGGAEKVTVDIYNEFDREVFNYRLCVATNKLDFLSKVKYKEEVLLLKKSRTLKSIPFWLKIIFEEDPDLIVGLLKDANIISGLSALIYNKPFVLIDHGGILAFNKNNINNSLLDKIKKKILNYVHSKAKKTIVVSPEIKKVLKKQFDISSKDIKVINNSISIREIEQKSKYKVNLNNFQDYSPRIVSIGRLSKEKGHEYLIKAANYLKHKYSKFGVFIIGAGSEKKRLSNLINKNNLENNVFLLGKKNNPYNYLKNSNVFVLPSLRESFSLAICEAGVCKTPVVTTNWDGIEEIYKNSYSRKLLIAKKKDPYSLYKRIVRVLESKQLNKKLVSNMYSFVKEISDFNEVVKEYESVFKNVLNLN